jgi:biotin synthase
MGKPIDEESLQIIPSVIRVSTGSAIVLGLLEGKIDTAPTTVYLMTYRESKCSANCGFCPQARNSSSKADKLSRISWPPFPTNQVIDRIKETARTGVIKRVCIQALNYPEVFEHLVSLTKAISQLTQASISISCQPLSSRNLRLLADAGVDRIGIPLDAATEELFEKVKGTAVDGPYSWKEQFELLRQAVNILGRGKVSTHLIVGLGETEKQMVKTIQECADMGVLPGLFAFTPIAGTALQGQAQPMIHSYRRIQVARQFILLGIARFDDMHFDKNGSLTSFGVDKKTLVQLIQTGEPFLTSGCPNCNRPYYNERPSGPIYNYPRNLTPRELSEIKKQLGMNEA